MSAEFQGSTGKLASTSISLQWNRYTCKDVMIAAELVEGLRNETCKPFTVAVVQKFYRGGKARVPADSKKYDIAP